MVQGIVESALVIKIEPHVGRVIGTAWIGKRVTRPCDDTVVASVLRAHVMIRLSVLLTFE